MLKTTVETQSENHYQVFQENAIPGSHQSPRTMPTFHIPIIGTSPCKDGNVFEPAKIDPKDAIKKFSISRKDATLLPKLQYEEVNKVHLENVKTIDLCSSGYDFSKYHNGKPFEKKVFLPKITFETSFEREVPSQSTSFQFFQNKDFESQNRDSFSSDATICQNSNGYKFHPSFQDFLNKEGKQFGIPVFKEIGNDQDKGGGIINEKLRPKLKPSTFGNGNFQLVKTPTPTVNPLNHFASYVSLVGNDEKFFEKLGSNDELSMIQQNFLIEVERLKHITGKIQNFIDNEFLKEFEKDNGRNSMFLNLEKDQLLQKLKNITGVLPLDIQSQDSTKFFLKNSEKDKIQLTINSLQEIQVSLESWFPQAFTDEVQELETNDVFDDSDGTVDISSTDNEREIIYHASTSASDDGFVSSNDGQNTGKKEEEEETQKKKLIGQVSSKKSQKKPTMSLVARSNFSKLAGKSKANNEKPNNNNIPVIEKKQKVFKERKKRISRKLAKESVCKQCSARETPEWRKGPYGEGSICNACGLFYKKLIRKFGSNNADKVMKSRKANNSPSNRILPNSLDELDRFPD